LLPNRLSAPVYYVLQITVNASAARMYSLERRVAKIEKERGVTDGDDFFNQTLRQLCPGVLFW
jgi:hypothetical protein